MNLTKVKLALFANKYVYLNLDNVVVVSIDSHDGHTEDHYHVLLANGYTEHIALDDPTISGLISASNTAYSGT